MFIRLQYIKNHYRLTAVDLSRQKELDVDPKTIRQIELGRQLNNVNGTNADGPKSMFIFTILEKIKEERLKLSPRSITVFKR